MGCTSSIYDNPDLERTQLEVSKNGLVKDTNGQLVRPSSTNSRLGGKPLISSLKSTRVTPLPPITVSNEKNSMIEDQPSKSVNGRASPARSDGTEPRSVKRVAFFEDLIHDSQQTDGQDVGNASRSLSGSPLDRRRAKKKRERVLKKRLLAKMSMAESMSERMLLESERLSLTSSMSRATSRTGSPLPYRCSASDLKDEQEHPTTTQHSNPLPPQSDEMAGKPSSALTEVLEEQEAATNSNTMTVVD